MKYTIKFLVTILLFLFSNNILAKCISDIDVKNIYNGFPKKPITIISKNISLKDAYCVQKKLTNLIAKNNEPHIGYKVGFTGKASQDIFNIKQPATGLLYKHMFVPSGSSISKNFGYRTLIEPDFLVIIKNSDIMLAETKLDALKSIKTIHSYVEIPALRFTKDTEINGNMLVAGNMLATKMVLGNGLLLEPSLAMVDKIANIEAVFEDAEGNLIQKVSLSNLMGNPLNVLLWLIKNFNEKGIVLKENDMISLGSVGKLFPLEKKTYIYRLSLTPSDVSELTVVIN